MKKVISVILILLMTICITGNVYAVLKCNIDMATEKSEYNKGGVFTVNVNISNIESDRGVISCGGILEYDKDSLKLEKIQGVNGWETPGIGTSYNETNGKFITTRSELGKVDETILKLTFTVINESKQNTVITLKDVTLADGTSIAKIDETNKHITLKQETQTPNPPSEEDNTNSEPKPNPEPEEDNTNNNPKPNPEPGEDNTNNTQKPSNNLNTVDNVSKGNNISKGDNTTTDQTLPKAGDKSTIIPIIGSLIIISIVCLIKMQIIKKQ